MAMKPCSKCKSPHWKFDFNDRTQEVKATCMRCQKVVNFLSKKGRRVAAGWVPPALTKGVHAPDYEPIQHGPAPGAKGKELAPPWIPLDEQDEWVRQNYPGETL